MEVCSSVAVVVSAGGSVVVGGGGAVMTISGRQVGLLPQKITSARCTQSEPGGSENRKVNTCALVLYGKHNLTRESQEVILGMVLATGDPSSTTCMNCTPIPHCGQLNITTSTLSTLTKPGIS